MTSSTPPYEWIFSGIGVAILAWFGAWAYRHYRKESEKRTENASQVKISDEQRRRRKDFERAAGERDSNAVPFPRPLLLLGDARTLL
jgi:hypothetical protein